MRNVLLSFIVAISILSCNSGHSDNQERCITDTIPEMVMQIKKCSKLYTTECRIHKIVTHNDKLSMSGNFLNHDYNIDLPLGQRKIAIPIDATVKAYIDFSDFYASNIHKDKDKIEIILPDPHIIITSTRIEHDQIKQYVSILRKNFSSEELYNYTRQGRDSIIKDLPQLDLFTRAQSDAANILIPIITQMGYKEANITITFRKEFTPQDIQSLITVQDITNGEKR